MQIDSRFSVLDEQEMAAIDGGSNVAYAVGYVLGVLVQATENYENPRYSGDWQG